MESNLNLYRREVASKIMKDIVPLFVNFSWRLLKISAAKNKKGKNVIKDKEYNKRQFRFPSFVTWKQLSRPYFCSQSFYVLSRGKQHFVGIFVTNARWVHSEMSEFSLDEFSGYTWLSIDATTKRLTVYPRKWGECFREKSLVSRNWTKMIERTRKIIISYITGNCCYYSLLHFDRVIENEEIIRYINDTLIIKSTIYVYI